MANILITYADKNFSNSLWLFKKRAKQLGIFDKIIIYGADDLPLPVKALPVMLYKRGGGYYAWKPWVINDALNHADIGDCIFYIDSGCTLRNGPEWQKYTQLMQRHDAVFFGYRSDFDYHWPCPHLHIKHWTKPAMLKYTEPYFGDDSHGDMPMSWAGFMIVKKTKDPISTIKDWYDISMMHPQLLADPYGPELLSLPTDFVAHRHDQSLLSILIQYYKDKENIALIPETSESQKYTAAVAATRYRVGPLPLFQLVKFRIFHTLQLLKTPKNT